MQAGDISRINLESHLELSRGSVLLSDPPEDGAVHAANLDAVRFERYGLLEPFRGVVELAGIKESHRVSLHELGLCRIRFDGFLHGFEHPRVIYFGMSCREFALGLG